MILKPTDPLHLFKQFGGGKAYHLAELTQMGFNVPPWICVASSVDSSDDFKKSLAQTLQEAGLLDTPVAVRSSGIGEDSSDCSFAGIHSSYLFQNGIDEILESIEQCRASCFSERAIEYRKQQGLSLDKIQTGIVIQKMIHSEISGVAFSRDPIAIDRGGRVAVNSVWGIGEGLVSGEIEGDLFYIDRKSLRIESNIADKEHLFVQAPSRGLQKIETEKAKRNLASLTDSEAGDVAKLAIRLEDHYGRPQDVEWAFERGILYCLQTRPVTTLPPSAYYESGSPSLWDNSNIVESYSGVTTPLTFSFANFCYEQVYRQFCEVIAVTPKTIQLYDPVFRNMLGLIRGRIYYNLVNWYRLAILLPGAGSNKGFMETMMGVKQALTSELSASIGFPEKPPKSSRFSQAKLYAASLWRFLTIRRIVDRFETHFNAVYSEARKSNFKQMSISNLIALYRSLSEKILKRWQAPIINDCLCMIFFGILKKLTEKWIGSSDPSLQNDLLSGEGGLESAKPTLRLMEIAAKIDDANPAFKEQFLQNPSLDSCPEEIRSLFETFLDEYGFRCVDELKLESQDLHDNPAFILDAVANYVRMKTYTPSAEQPIRKRAEERVFSFLKGAKKWIYKFVLKHARRAIRVRENMRFSRTKIFGVVRQIFRNIGARYAQLGILESSSDIFYLTVDEIFAYAEGRAVDLKPAILVEQRKKEFESFKNTPSPPDRFITFGPAGLDSAHQWFSSLDEKAPDHPHLLKGTPCSPGIVEGTVRVVRDLSEARALNGEILVTERTDPGWVPLYPSCSGLLIERGSLLSHSAVVARELGLPTIVGVSGLMQKLQTGMKVKIDAALGTIEILSSAYTEM